jgi:hypothetical protein
MHTLRGLNKGRCLGTLCLLAAAATACAGAPRLVEDLDPVTGVTMTRSSEALVLYRDNSGRAAYARDYVYMGPVSVNRMGAYRYFIWLGAWSTIQARDATSLRDGLETAILFVDGEPLSLDMLGWTPEAVGLSAAPYPPPAASTVDAYYEVTIDQIRMIAEAREVRLLIGGADPANYEPWDNQTMTRAGWQAFVDEVGY